MINKNTFRSLSYGVYIISTLDGVRPTGCVANSAMQITSEPATIAVSINHDNYTNACIEKTGKFALSILSEESNPGLIGTFGFQSGKDVDKFADFKDCKRGLNDLYYITKGTNGYISAWVQEAIDLGTHTLFIGGVTDMEVLSDAPSVTYAYYQSDIKPKPQPKKEAGKTVWRCMVCGYEYEGETIPEDFICPICKHPASDFNKAE